MERDYRWAKKVTLAKIKRTMSRGSFLTCVNDRRTFWFGERYKELCGIDRRYHLPSMYSCAFCYLIVLRRKENSEINDCHDICPVAKLCKVFDLRLNKGTAFTLESLNYYHCALKKIEMEVL